MKGPGLKLGLEIRRRWRCAETGKILFMPGDVTALRSPFTKEDTWMILEEEQKAFREIVPVESFVSTEIMEPLSASEIRVPISPEEQNAPPEETTSKENSTEETEPHEDSFAEGIEAEDTGTVEQSEVEPNSKSENELP